MGHGPEQYLLDVQRRLMLLERRPSGFIMPDRLSTEGQLATDLNATIDNGNYHGSTPANAPFPTANAAWRVLRAGDNAAKIRQEFYRVTVGTPTASNPPPDTRVWVRHSIDAGATWSAWSILSGSDTPTPVDLSSYVVSGGTLFGLKDGRSRELHGTGHTAAAGAAITPAWNALPTEWRPVGANRHGVGYSANWQVGVVMRPDGTGALANRASGTNLTTIQFSIFYLV